MLKMYQGHSGSAGPEEGAMLIFAHDRDEARMLCYDVLRGWFQSDWCDVRVRLLKNSPHLLEEADKEKYARDEAHVNDSPQTCKDCELWGTFIHENGYCEDCIENHPIIP
jgi:hypothetical protein